MARIGTNLQHGQTTTLPYVRIQDDWDHTIDTSALCDVVRCMGRDGYKDTAVGSTVQLDNERDKVFATPGDRLAKIAEIRSLRPDLLIVSTPSAPQNRAEDVAAAWYAKELAACNFIGWHSAVYEDPALAITLSWTMGASAANTIILEVEADPAEAGDIDKIPAWMAKAAQLGYKGVYAWGDSPTRANINDRSDLVAEIKAIPPANTSVVEAARTRAEKAYNQLTGGAPMIPGQQYVQANLDGSYTVVVRYS